jgi:hypothetical protein
LQRDEHFVTLSFFFFFFICRFSAPKSLETIVEAIRHLEGDQMFESIAQNQHQQRQCHSPVKVVGSLSSKPVEATYMHHSQQRLPVVGPHVAHPTHSSSLVVVNRGGGGGGGSDESLLEDDEQPLALTVGTPVTDAGRGGSVMPNGQLKLENWSTLSKVGYSSWNMDAKRGNLANLVSIT